MSKITFHMVSSTYQDCTADYEIETTCSTIGEFLETLAGYSRLNYKLSGWVTIKRKDYVEPFGLMCNRLGDAEYNDSGFKVSNEVDLSSKIVSVAANGAYGLFNFDVVIE